MSVKSLKKQFAAAIAMVVVSAVALSSSTYAWFVGQNTAKADGLTIQAQSEAGLLIRHGEDAFASSATGSFTTAQKLYPTSTNNGSAWFHASAESLTASTATDGSMKTLGITETAGVGKEGDKAYYIVDSFDLYSTGTATNLVIESINVANTRAGFDESLRLLVVCGTNKFVFAPSKSVAETTYIVGKNPDGNTSAGTSTTAYGVASTGGFASKVLAATVSADPDAPTPVKIYAYFEGEDAQHYTNNFTQVDSLAITLNFSADVVAPTE